MEDWLKDILRRLRIDDASFIEIESKRRVVPEEVDPLRKRILKDPRVRFKKSENFFDQFLDTPRRVLFRRGASLRLRYKRDGTRVYLQYKGPGFHHCGILYRSEFSTKALRGVMREESHHDVIRFDGATVRDIMRHELPDDMKAAMKRHLGPGILDQVFLAPIVCAYHKEKFVLDHGAAFLEPSIDKVFAFHISRSGIHQLSAFFEYEDEVKSDKNSLKAKYAHLDDLLSFDAELARRFNMPREPLDKYHRCASFFLSD